MSLAFTARALGPELFGVLVLIQTYTRLIDQLVNFQSWQAIIKYGADSLTHGRTQDFRSLIKFGTLLDISASLFGTAVALVLLFWVSGWLDWDSSTTSLAAIYALSILFSVVPTPTAVLRLFDRFRLFAVQQVIAAAVRMIAVLIAWYAEAGIVGFLAVWMSTQIFAYLLLLALGWRELRQQGYGDAMLGTLAGIRSKFPGVWKFVLTTNVSSSIRLGAKEVDVLIIGGVLDSATAGLYKVAKQFASIPARLGEPIQQAVYPDMARLWAEGERGKFIQTVVRTGVLAGLAGIGVWLGFFVLGEWAITLTVGAAYEASNSILLVYMLGLNVFMFGIAFRPAVLAIGRPERILLIYVVSTIIYFAVLLWLITPYGAIGAALAQVVFHITWFVAMILSLAVFLKRSKG